MNKILILVCLGLMGCAEGVVDEPIVKVEEDTISPPRSPAPISQEESDKNCEVVRTVYANNCVLKIIKCSDGTTDIDSYCFGPAYVPPWEWIPDPPYKERSQ